MEDRGDIPQRGGRRRRAADRPDARVELGGIRRAWERARAPHETWRDRGRREIADAQGEIGFTRFIVADAGGRIAGMILLNLVGDTAGFDPSLAAPEERGALELIRLARTRSSSARSRRRNGRGAGVSRRELLSIADASRSRTPRAGHAHRQRRQWRGGAAVPPARLHGLRRSPQHRPSALSGRIPADPDGEEAPQAGSAASTAAG